MQPPWDLLYKHIYETRNIPPEKFGYAFIQVSQVLISRKKAFFAEKRALTKSTESVLLSPNKRAQELFC